MDIRQFRVLQTVCETGSVTETARCLNVSQPAISKTLRQLEAQSGLQLFESSQGRLFPTAQARSLLPVIARLLASHDDAKRQIEELRSGQRGLVTIACFPSLMPGLLADAIDQFRKAKPLAKLKVVAAPTRRIVELVAKSEVDIGVCQPSSGDAAVEARILAAGQVVCAMPRSHRLAQRERISPADLHGEDIITFPDTDPTGVHIGEAFDLAGTRLRRAIEVNQSYGTASFVRKGLGIGILDSFMEAESLVEGLVVRPFEPFIPIYVHVQTSAIRPLSPLAQLFVEQLALVSAGQHER